MNTLIIEKVDKKARYAEIIPQIKVLVTGENDLTANLANVVAALKESFNFFWVGFYIVKGDNLVLGPFQGSIACTRIKKGRGVCGTVWETRHTCVVPNVDDFPGHIACNANSRSEIVIPIFVNEEVVAVLDIDSDQYAMFDEVDASSLELLCQVLTTVFETQES